MALTEQIYLSEDLVTIAGHAWQPVSTMRSLKLKKDWEQLP